MLSSTGRMARLPFIAAAMVLFLLAGFYDTLAPPDVRRWTAFVVYCALLFSTACIISKRLHDLGKRGWWAFLPVFAIMGCYRLPPAGWFGFVSLAVLIVFAVALMAIPGQKRFNRFGPPAGR